LSPHSGEHGHSELLEGILIEVEVQEERCEIGSELEGNVLVKDAFNDHLKGENLF